MSYRESSWSEAYRAGHRAGKTQQEVNEKGCSSILKTITDIMKGLSDVWKVNIELTDPSNISNGYYKDSTIYINANISDILLDTFTHELTTTWRNLAPKEWKAYADLSRRK